MSEAWMAFTLVCLLALAFAIVLAVVVLRFLTVLTQLKRSDSFERSEMMNQLDHSHVAAFTNAMTALERVSEKITASHAALFERTMDAVHGPQRQPTDNTPYMVDNPVLDMRLPWQPDDNGDTGFLYADPTDDLEPDPQPEVDGEGSDRSNGFAVSVRPGEGLIPGQRFR